MTSRRRPASRLGALAAAAALTLGACSGSTDGDSADTGEDDAAGVTPIDDDLEADVTPIDTEPTTSTSEPATTTTISSETPAADDEAICDATLAAFVPGRAIRFLSADDGAGFEASIKAVATNTTALVALDPSNQDAIAVSDALVELIPIFESQDFVEFDPETLPDGGARFEELGAITGAGGDAFEATLLEECAYTDDDLDAAGIAFAETVASGPVNAPGQADDGGDEPFGATITDDSGTIEVVVPDAWTDVDGSPGDGTSLLVASTDAQGFLNGFDVPGVFIETAPVDDGPAAAQAAVDRVAGNYVEIGCAEVGRTDYSDSLYTGFEATLECVAGFDTIVIAGTNDAGDVVFVVALVVADDDVTTRDLIADSFVVG